MKRMLALTLIALAIILSVFMTVHLIWESPTGADLFVRNGHEAYLVVGTRRTGWSGSTPAYAWQLVRTYFNLGVDPDRSDEWITVVQLTDTGTKTHSIHGTSFGHYSIVGDTLRAVHDGQIETWDGTVFKAVEQKEGSEPSESGGTQKSSDPRWSVVRGLLNRGTGRTAFPVEVVGMRYEIVATVTRGDDDFAALELVAPGSAVETLVRFDLGPTRIDANRYESLWSARELK